MASSSSFVLGVISVRLGRPLKWDPVKEEFVGDKEANKWLAREVRKPYDHGDVVLDVDLLEPHPMLWSRPFKRDFVLLPK